MEQYTEKEREILKKLYKGPKYWTVTGTLKYETPGLPGDEFKEVTLKKVHWTTLATYGPEGTLGVHFKKTPVEGSCNWFPYYDLPVWPELPDKVIKDN